MPHVKKWWDQDVTYTLESVREKYGSYVQGYKQVEGVNKPIHSFIIYLDGLPTGYIQIYNAYDFPRSKPLLALPENLGAFDVFIGEKKSLGQNWGSKIIIEFLKVHASQYNYVFVDPDSSNIAALKCYEKAGFKKMPQQPDTGEVWMLWDRTTLIYFIGKPGVGKYTISKELAKESGFIICDNQLINNPIFELLQYNGYGTVPGFALDAISKIRVEIFDFLSKELEKNYILTNCLADTDEDRNLYNQVKRVAELRGSLFIPMRLSITEEEHLKRLTQLTRRARWKSIDPVDAADHGPLLSISHPNFIELEVSNLTPACAAQAIMQHIRNKRSSLFAPIKKR